MRSKYTASLRCPECSETFERPLRSFITVHSDGSYLPVGCPHCGYTPRENPEENLLKVCPEIVEWWDYEKNDPHLPEEYTVGSQETAYLKCPDCGMELFTGIHSLVETLDDGTVVIRHKGRCQKYKNLKSDNNIVARYPEIKLWWDYKKNPNPPEEYTLFSPQGVNFKCPDCGSETYRRITDAFSLNADGIPVIFNCPYCAGIRVMPGINSFGDLHPDLLPELYELGNAGMGRSPFDMMGTSREKLWWICAKEKKHKYLMSPSKRLMFQKRDREPCPYCRGQRRKLNHYINYYANKKNNDIDI